MVKSDSHIDVLFRDGLNSMEVLPPASVWEDIAPAIKKTNSRGLIFRVAAGVAVLTSLGMLTYFFATGSFSSLQNQIATAEQDVLSPINNPSLLASNENASVNDLNLIHNVADAEPVANRVVQSEISDMNSVTPTPMRIRDIERTVTNEEEMVLYDTHPPQAIEFESDPFIVNTEELLAVDERYRVFGNDRWRLGAVVSPNYLSTNLKAANEAIGKLKDNESAILSYSGGVSVSYKMSGRVSIQTGVYYSSMGRRVNGIDSYTGYHGYASSKSGRIFGVESSTGQISSTNGNVYLVDAAAVRISDLYIVDNFDPVKADLSPLGSALQQNFKYLEIPFIIRYKLIDKKLDFNVLGGMSYNILMGNQTYAIGEGSKVLIGSTDGLDKLLLSSSVGMSMEYNLSDKFSLNVEPHFRYFLTTEGGFLSDNPYTFGVFSGLYYRF